MKNYSNKKFYNKCEICGISVFSDNNSIIYNKDKFKRVGHYLYKGVIHAKTDGPLMTISNGHVNWYQYKNADPTKIFTFLECVL